MANMRVHELAKELNISSKEIIETLSNDTKKYTASNGLTDSEITSIRSKFGKKAAQPEKPKTEAKQEDKKSHISQVYFPQNSTKAPGNDTRKGNQNQTKNDNQMNNRNNNQNNNRKSDTPRNENGRNNYAGTVTTTVTTVTEMTVAETETDITVTEMTVTETAAETTATETIGMTATETVAEITATKRP